MKLPYQEGDWFAVPLHSGGYGVGLIARCDREGGVLGYFFGPKRTKAPTLPEVMDLQPKESVRVLNFGDLGLIDGDWPIIGRTPSWDREQWPVPAFARRDPLSGRSWKVIYNDDLIKGEGSELQAISETSISMTSNPCR